MHKHDKLEAIFRYNHKRDMNLQKAIMEIADKNSITITEQKAMKGGINNGVIRIKDENNKKYALKIYRNMKGKNRRDTMHCEITFLKYLEKLKIANTTKVLIRDENNRIALLKWIDGEKPMNLSNDNILQISDFLKNINNEERIEKKIQYAAEPLITLHSFTNNIQDKLKQLEIIMPETELEKIISSWIKSTLMPNILLQLNHLENVSYNTCWNTTDMGKYLTPSDVGIHNTILNGKDMFFIDFEYAGYDDISKTLADWTLQPEYLFTKKQTELLLDTLTAWTKCKAWIDRYYHIRKIISLKWVIIMLRGYRERTMTTKQWDKIKDYYLATSRLLCDTVNEKSIEKKEWI